MNREERVVKYINSSDDFIVNGKRYCENDFYNDVEDLAKENQELKELVNYLRRSIERKEETIVELENERVPYANEYVEKLKQENKQLKEAINRAIEELKKGLHELDTRRREEVYVEEYLEESIEILEEVSS